MVISFPVKAKVSFNSIPFTPEVIWRIAEIPGIMIKDERHTNQCESVLKANMKGRMSDKTKVARYSVRTKPVPKRTANVLLPTFLSVGSSRKLLTASRAVANKPGPKPARITTSEISSDCT